MTIYGNGSKPHKYYYFIRHGQQMSTGKCWKNAPLTLLGIQQAKLTGKKLLELGCQKIYSSDLPRTKETSEIINHFLNTELIYSSKLREIDYGSLEGEDEEIIAKFVSGYNYLPQNSDFNYPNGECGSDVFNRSFNYWRNVIANSSEDKIGIITHGELILVLLCGLWKIDFGKRLKLVWLDHCGITLIESGGTLDTMIVKYINNTTHLLNAI